MDIQLSERVQRVKPSMTLEIAAKAKQFKAEGRDIVSLDAGQPDFATPAHIIQAAKQAMDNGETGYTAVDGTPMVKQAIIDKFKRDNGLDYQMDQILVSSGGKQSFYNLCQAFLNTGDEVIIPAPYWVSYPDMVLLADATPVIVTATQQTGFKLTPKQLESAITASTRLFVINSPSNPTGVAYRQNELAALAEVLSQYPHIIIATDDMYEHVVFSGKSFCNILDVAPDLYHRTVVLNGVSKAYAMTGWRIGYAGGPAKLIQAMKKIQSQSTSNPVSISQAATVEALNGNQDHIKTYGEAYERRHAFVLKALNQIDGVHCLPSDGTFYSFPNVKGMMARLGLDSDIALADYLLESCDLSVVPGEAFGLKGHIRLSFATSMAQLKKGLARLAKV